MTTEPDNTNEPVNAGTDEQELHGTVGPRMTRRRVLQATGAAAGAAAVGTTYGVQEDYLEPPVKEADAAVPLLLIPAAYPLATAVAAMAGGVLLTQWLTDDGDLEELRGELAELDDESAAVTLAEISRAVASQETQYLIERESRFNFAATVDGANTSIAEYGDPDTISYLDTAWSEVRAGAGAEFAAGGDADSAEPVATDRARAVEMSSAVSMLENANANFESLAYAFADQASRDAVSVFKLGDDSTEPVAAGGRPGGTVATAVDYDNADPVVISIPLETAENYPDPAGFNDVADDYEPRVLAVYNGTDWIPATSLGNLPFNIAEDVVTTNITSTTTDVYADHEDFEETAHPHVGSSFGAAVDQLDAAATQLIDTDIPDFVNAAESQIAEGEIEPEDLIGARELVGRFSDTSNFSRFAAELAGAGFRMPGDGSLGTQATVAHDGLASISAEHLDTISTGGSVTQRVAVSPDAIFHAEGDGNGGVEFYRTPFDGSPELVGSSTDASSINNVALFFDGENSEVIAHDLDTGDWIWRVGNGSVTELSAPSAVAYDYDGSAKNDPAAVDYDTSRGLLITIDGVNSEVHAVDPRADGGPVSVRSWTVSSGDIDAVTFNRQRDEVIAATGAELEVFDAGGEAVGSIDMQSGEMEYNGVAATGIESFGSDVVLARSVSDYPGFVFDRVLPDPNAPELVNRADLDGTEYNLGSAPRQFAVNADAGIVVVQDPSNDRLVSIDIPAEAGAAEYPAPTHSGKRGVHFVARDEQMEVWSHADGVIYRHAAGGAITGDNEATGHLFIDTNAEATIEEGASLSETQYETAYLLTVESGATEHTAVLMDSDEGPIEILEVHIDEETESSADDAESASDDEVNEEDGTGINTTETPEDGEDTDTGTVTSDHYIEVPGDDEDIERLSDRGDVQVSVVDVSTGDTLETRPASDIEQITVSGEDEWALPVESSYSDVRLTYDSGFTMTQPVEGEQDPTSPEEIREQVEQIAQAIQEIEEARQNAVDEAESSGGPGMLGMLAGGGIVAAILYMLFGDESGL